MRKILFLQIKGNSLGGVWFVNKALGEEFLKRGYHVEVLAIRNNHPGIEINDTPLKINVINKEDLWEIVHRRDVLKAVFKNFFKTLKQYFEDKKKLDNDFFKMKDFIKEYNPDYIIVSHYQLLLGIPDEYLSKVIFVQHSSFKYLIDDKYAIRLLKKYKNKIFKMCWLCKSTLDDAIKFDFKNSTYIYNPNKFITDKQADVVKNKKIVVITRIHPEKRIDLMISMVNDVFMNNKFRDWKFEIYGTGSFNEESKKILKESKQIEFKGLTDNPMEILLKSSLTLNTSVYEGFSLSIIEGYTCGLPVISFNFGETVYEEIKDGKTGFVINQGDIENFKIKLIKLLSSPNLLKEMSDNAKTFSKQFEVSKVADKWEELFKHMEE